MSDSTTAAAPMGFVYVQEGGSSTELYLHAFDTRIQAEEGAKSCADSSYRTSPIIEVPIALLDTPGFCDTVQSILMASLDMEYAE